jgi:multidrug efflux pump subunit AcrA (membrane-fusion protein)
VLVKSALRDRPPSVRTQQFIRSRIIWRSAPGLTVPITAVTRINGKYFCFVVDSSAQGTVARQRAIDVGDLMGNDYVVKSGLAAGDRLIVSGIQKIGDGAPVKPE